MSFPIDVSACFSPEIVGDTFTIYSEEKNFEDASKFCGEKGSTLARISNQEEYKFVKEMLEYIPQTEAPFSLWIGLYDSTNSTDASDTKFKFVDGFEDTSFFEKGNEFPWKSNEPDNLFQNSNCVDWTADAESNHFWEDSSCDSTKRVLCRKRDSCFLTLSPSMTPTTSPIVFNSSTPVPTLTAVKEVEDAYMDEGLKHLVLGGVLIALMIMLSMFTSSLRKETTSKKNLEQNLNALVQQSEKFLDQII